LRIPKTNTLNTCKQEGEARYTAEITVLVSDNTGATTTWSGATTLTIQAPYLGKSEEDIAAALAQVVEGKVVESLLKGDSSVALSTVSNVASAAGKTDAEARRQRPEQTLLGRSLLEHLKAAANLRVIRPENVVEVIQTLSAVTQLKEAFNTTHIQQIFDLELQFALRVSGSSMTIHTAGLFVKALSDLLEPSFVNDIIENDFGTAFLQAGGGGRYSLETTNFTSTLSSTFENIKVEVGNALLTAQVEGEASVKISAGGVSVSAQKQRADNVGDTLLREFAGAEFSLPDDILGAIGAAANSSVFIFVGYTELVWPGNAPVDDVSSSNESFVNLKFGRGVHSLSLGKADGSGLHRVKNLTTPVVMMFEVQTPEFNTTTNATANNETISIQPQCLYWDIDEGAWSSEGCAVTLYNETHMECTCNHLTGFGTAFKQIATSADFTAATSVELITVENILENPLPFVFLFTLYFLTGMGVILGSKLDASSKVSQSDRLANMLQFDSYRQIQIKVPLLVRVTRAMFLVANMVLALLAIVVGVCGLVTFDSTFHWIFGNLGNYAVIAYACSQCGMCALGLFLIGVVPGKGSHRLCSGVWLLLGVSILLLHVYGLTLAQDRVVRVPAVFCPSGSRSSAGRDDGKACLQSWRSLLLPFWNGTEPWERQKVFEEHFQGLNCTSRTSSGAWRGVAWRAYESTGQTDRHISIRFAYVSFSCPVVMLVCVPSPCIYTYICVCLCLSLYLCVRVYLLSLM
jgi:hypothetical protein